MDDDTNPTTHRPPRHRALVLRWVACTFLVAGVVVAARLSAETGYSPQAAPTAPAVPSHGTTSTPATPEGESLDVDDPFAVLDGLIEETFGPDPDDPPATGPADPNNSDWTTLEGVGATGGSWTIAHPTDWQIAEPDAGVVVFSAPDYSEIATVVTRPYDGSLEEEAASDIDRVLLGLADGVLLEFENSDTGGREAIQAGIAYTNSAGDQTVVALSWIRDGDTLYLLAGEAPVDRVDLQALVDETLSSFSIDEAF